MGTMMSVAAWGGGAGGADSIRVARAIDAVRDTVDRLDSLLLPSQRAFIDSTRRAVRNQTGISPDSESLVRGYALDRGGLAVAAAADSGLLDLGGQFLWIGKGRPTARRVGIHDPGNDLHTRAVVEMRDGSVTTLSRSEHGSRTVTVLAPDAITAGAWASALLPLGCDSALALIGRPDLAELHVSVICADSAGVRWTADLEKRVQLPRSAGRAEGRAGRGP
jgi:thiamine biosynthesis lipoprotein ApbE